MHYKCVILVIAHHDPIYDQCKEIWEAHWQAHAAALGDYRVYFLYNEPGRTAVEGHDLIFPHEETYPFPGLLLKTMDALEYLRDSGVTYDMVFRTNLSTLLNFRAFKEYVETNVDKELFYAGRKYGDRHISGCGMLMSRDIVRMLMEHRSELALHEPDDHAINLFLQAKIPYLMLHEIPNAAPSSRGEMDGFTNSNVIHFRFRSKNRQQDIDNMRYMVSLWNPRSHMGIQRWHVILLVAFVCIGLLFFRLSNM